MLHTQVSEKDIHFSIMYTPAQISPVLTIKHKLNKDVEPTTPHKLETGTTPSVSNLLVLFCSFFVKNATAHVETKSLNRCVVPDSDGTIYLVDINGTR